LKIMLFISLSISRVMQSATFRVRYWEMLFPMLQSSCRSRNNLILSTESYSSDFFDRSVTTAISNLCNSKKNIYSSDQKKKDDGRSIKELDQKFDVTRKRTAR